MKSTIAIVGLALLTTTALAQRPTDPALIVPQSAPALAFVLAPQAVTLPAGIEMGAPATVAFDKDGHLFVLTRGERTFFEFDENGAFVRSFGERLFTRSHGLAIDDDGNFWATDVGGHIVVKLNPRGEMLLTIGTKGEAGAWDEALGLRKLNQPNDVALAPNGDVFIVQGHTPGPNGDARVLKFDGNGRYLTQWGGKGAGPGQFQVAHGIDIDAEGLVWVADRENQRVQVFTQDGAFVKELKYAGLPCDVDIGRESIFMVNGFAGQLVELALDGGVRAALGKPGTAPGEFGEAHMLAVSPRGEIFVADSVNAALFKFVRKP